MLAIESALVDEIEGLNQRGGRMLSVVDLIAANTLDAEMAALLWYAVAHGCSFLTAARPGNAGKTTVLASLLGFLAPGTRLVTVSDPGVLARPLSPPACFLVHEIGDGPWFGYLWGKHVATFVQQLTQGYQSGSCLHADTVEEVAEILLSSPLALTPEHFQQIDLLLFLRMEATPYSLTRRVAQVCEAREDRHHPLFAWNRQTDEFTRTGASALLARIARETGRSDAQVAEEVQKAGTYLRKLTAGKEKRFDQVRARLVDFMQTRWP